MCKTRLGLPLEDGLEQCLGCWHHWAEGIMRGPSEVVLIYLSNHGGGYVSWVSYHSNSVSDDMR